MAAWVLADAVYSGNSYTPSQGAFRGIYIKPDGTELYVVDESDDAVYQHTLSSAWDLISASYSGNSFTVTQDTGEKYIWFKDDGTKMYIVGNGTDDAFQYSLSTAWDVSTASYDSVSFALSASAITPLGLHFKPDGTSFYVANLRDDNVLQFDLSTAWDLSTASISANTFSIVSQSANATGLSFKDDGTKMYVLDFTNADIYQYSLSTAWDISTASYDSVSFDVSAQAAVPYGLFFGNDGNRIYTSDATTLYEYILNATTGRAVDEASAGGTQAVLANSLNTAPLSVSLNSAITAPASPTGNT